MHEIGPSAQMRRTSHEWLPNSTRTSFPRHETILEATRTQTQNYRKFYSTIWVRRHFGGGRQEAVARKWKALHRMTPRTLGDLIAEVAGANKGGQLISIAKTAASRSQLGLEAVRLPAVST